MEKLGTFGYTYIVDRHRRKKITLWKNILSHLFNMKDNQKENIRELPFFISGWGFEKVCLFFRFFFFKCLLQKYLFSLKLIKSQQIACIIQR